MRVDEAKIGIGKIGKIGLAPPPKYPTGITRICVSDEVKEELVVLQGGEQVTVLNNNQVAVEKGKIVIAGSDVCKSSCNLYTEQHKKG
jgi:hypothetical protein